MSEMSLNLIPSKAKFQAARIKLQTRVRLVMMVLTIIWLLVMSVVIVTSSWLDSRVNAAMANRQRVQSNFDSMQTNIVTSQQLKYKTKMVGNVLAERYEYGSSFEAIGKMFPTGVQVKSYDMTDQGVFEIKGVVSGRENVDTLERTIDSINRGENELLTVAKVVSLTLKDGLWEFTMEVKLK